MLFDVNAKCYGDQVKFQLEIEDKPNETDELAIYRNARQKAKEQARVIFDYKSTGEDPTVALQASKDQAVGTTKKGSK